VLALSGETQSGHGRTSVSVIELLLGAALFVVGVRVWRRGPTLPTRSPDFGTHRLLGRMEGLTPVGAAVVGVLKQPWAITAAASLVVVHHHESALVVAIAFLLFTIASTATVGLMFLYYARYPGEAQARLAALRDRVVAAGPAMGAVAGMVVGVFLMIDGVLGLR
jgi:hypothetical protein